jgi:cell filamentation protein
MKDPYLYPDSDVLRNFFGIHDSVLLESVEADYTGFRLKQLMDSPLPGNFDFDHLCRIHKYIFQDIFEWAGKPRIINIFKAEPVLGGLSVEYSDVFDITDTCLSVLNEFNSTQWQALEIKEKSLLFAHLLTSLWRVHPFREGNTRTVITFCNDFADNRGFPLKRELFSDNSVYVRRALVAAAALSESYGDLSKPEYIENFIFDAMTDL